MTELYDRIGVGYRTARRPDPRIARAILPISTFSKLGALESGLARLRRDLEDGTWERRYGDLRRRSEIDLGYCLVVASP